MPKAILEFNLPEESEDHTHALRGLSYKIALDEMDNHLRDRLKYEDLTEEVRFALQNTRNFLINLIMDLDE